MANVFVCRVHWLRTFAIGRCLTTGRYVSPQKCPFPWGDLDSNLICGCLDCSRVSLQNDISFGEVTGSDIQAHFLTHNDQLSVFMAPLVSDIAILVLKRDVKLQVTITLWRHLVHRPRYMYLRVIRKRLVLE